MGSNADIVGAEATVEAESTLLLGHLDEAVHHASVGELAVGTLLLLLQSSLDEVEGQTEEGREETGNGTSTERLGAGREVGVGLELGLGLAEEGELTKVESHGADDSRGSTGPESGDALVLGDATEGIEDGLVVLSLGEGLQAVALHSDEGQIGGVSNHGSDGTGRETSTGTLSETDLSTLGLGSRGHGAHEGVEEAQAGSGIDGLSEKTGGETGVEVKDLAVGHDLSSDREGRGPGTGCGTLAGELDADLDHVDGLDNTGGNHAADAAVDKGEGSLDEGRPQEVGGNDTRLAPGGVHDLGGLGTGRLGGLLETSGAHDDGCEAVVDVLWVFRRAMRRQKTATDGSKKKRLADAAGCCC